ncbi:MAG TPA: HlyD family efflux transporter periplasmic adaptor subunit [Candidatus Acidoferrales bacterium]|nr:HlyD family efflux transporter periplasmic adaptor subunit [Candidatus Acidoferrales bacterium]
MTPRLASARCLLLMLFACIAVSACEPTTETPEEPPAAPIQVRVVHVHRGEIRDVLTVTGQTEALSVLRMASPVAGRVTALDVHAGDHLDKGEVAVRVIPLENEAAVHGFDVLQHAAALNATEGQVARRLEQDLSSRDIPLRAPFSAVVAQRLHNPGEQVAPTDVLLELFDPQSLYVLAQVPVESAARLGIGMPVDVTAAETPVTGRIVAIVSALEPQTLTVPVRISLTAPLELLLLHAAVECRITLARHADALVIPRSALVSSNVGDRGVVMVAVEDHAQQRAVRLGLHTQTDVEVTDGLAADEAVLVEGQYSLPDGTAIQPVPMTE